MKKSRILGVAVAATLAMGISSSAFATNGYQLIGIGQYAMGMGGAVVAAPGDPMAALSNPAGLSWIAPQVAFSAEVFNPTRSTNFGFGNIGSHTNIYAVPSLGWVAPVGHNLVFGGGMYGTSGLGTNYIQSIPAPFNKVLGDSVLATSNIQLFQMSPALSWKVNDHMSLGAALNIGYESASFQEVFGGPEGQSGFNLASPSSAYGIGLTLGMIYKVNPMVTLGLSYKTPQIYTPLNWQATGQFVPTKFVPSRTGGTVEGVSGNSGEYSAHLNYPQQVAFGMAIKPTKQWLVSVEGQWINWSATLGSFNIYGPWNGTNVVSLPTKWKNEWVFNIGTQYDLTNWLQVRAGYCYGTNPIGQGADTTANLLFPALIQNSITVGATQKLGKGWKLTEAYMHGFSNTNNGTPLLPGLEPYVQAGYVQNTSAKLTENSFGLQLGYDF
ncbi:OmpP1/FadL family transporter [Acidithiobacillus concretivorus]|uniref:Long-chain fatty acid transporter n=1 Tax=Acidithiobacillus concretivorus TaxID=3063952 RepID=A0ABS5ZP92_9PROT|nr:outer membrane protein transport protein [Acidithiobacillus concretivorus]MBU2738473.1 hypothetical protein [Acidithiobacillus concretivorus]